MGLLNPYRYQLVLFEKPTMTTQDLESALDFIGDQVDEPAMRRLLSRRSAFDSAKSATE